MAGDDDDRVLEWELGLPSDDDLTPLSYSLVPPVLAAAFRISPEPTKTPLDVHRASHQTLDSLRRNPSPAAPKPFRPFSDDQPVLTADDEPSSKARRLDSDDAETSSPRPDASSKRPRLVWTPQLHKRFVEVVAHLGIKNAVPKTVMKLMNVEGLTRENVASHLQKYRLYLKRMQGLSDEGPSSSDQLFASTPVPQSLREPPPPVPVPVKYALPTIMPMPMYGMSHHHHPAGMVPVHNYQGHPAYHGFESHHPYGSFGERPRDWPSGNNFGSMVSYPPRVTPNDR